METWQFIALIMVFGALLVVLTAYSNRKIDAFVDDVKVWLVGALNGKASDYDLGLVDKSVTNIENRLELLEQSVTKNHEELELFIQQRHNEALARIEKVEVAELRAKAAVLDAEVKAKRAAKKSVVKAAGKTAKQAQAAAPKQAQAPAKKAKKELPIVDWSKAPEGANHWDPFNEKWMMKIGEFWFRFVSGGCKICNPSPQLIAGFIKKPAKSRK